MPDQSVVTTKRHDGAAKPMSAGAPKELRCWPAGPRIAVVIPSYKVTRHILDVVAGIGPEVGAIYVVDDRCPDGSGAFVRENATDPRVRVVEHEHNLGVGGATMTGMRHAIADGAEVIVKVDGDGQMDPGLLPRFVRCIVEGEADYTKGNRFYNLEDVRAMPLTRLIGNAGLSFLAKLSTGYWHSFDPTNGYIAIHAKVAAQLPFDKINNRYFFETDLLFRLYTLHAKVIDVPMAAVYGDEVSNLHPYREMSRFFAGHMRNFGKRIFYSYFLRNFNIASIELLLSLILLPFGILFGLNHWGTQGVPASAGTVMLSGLPVILGIQFLIAFLNFDIQSTPASPIHHRL